MFTIFDGITLLFLLAGAYCGFKTGIIASIFYIASGFAGMWVAQHYVPVPGVKFYVYFLAAAGGVILLGFVAGKLMRTVSLGAIDRLIGACLGILLGLAVVSTVLVPLSHHLSPKFRKAVTVSYTGSHLIPRLQKIFPQVRQFDTDEIKSIFPLPAMPAKILPRK